MASVLYAGHTQQQQQQQQQQYSRSPLSAIFSRKKSRAANGILEAEQEADALDAFHIAADSRGASTAAAHLAGAQPGPAIRRGGAQSHGNGAGAVPLPHQQSATQSDDDDRGAAAVEALEAELHQLRSKYDHQAQQLAGMQEQLSRSQTAEVEARDKLHMQQLKFELLLDLAEIAGLSRLALSEVSFTSLRAISSTPTAFQSALIESLGEEAAYEKENYAVPEELEAGPPAGFALSEADGDTLMSLTKKVDGEVVTVDVMVNEQPEEELVEDANGALDADVGAVFTVTVAKGDQSLVFECKSDGQYFSVQHVSLEPAEDDMEDSAYSGPAYEELDEKLQANFESYLAERGVDKELGAYLLPLIHDKEQRRGGKSDKRDDGGRDRVRPRLPPRGPANPLLAEASRLARERELAKAQQASGSEGEEETPAKRPRESRHVLLVAWGCKELREGQQDARFTLMLPSLHAASRGWRATLEEDESREAPEDGELQQQEGNSGGVGSKRKHAPIVWHTPPKAAKGGQPATAEGSRATDSVPAGTGGGGSTAGMTATDRAMEELRAFQEQQAAAGDGSENESDGLPLMKPSPSVSSDEDEEEEGLGEQEVAAAQGQQQAPEGQRQEEQQQEDQDASAPRSSATAAAAAAAAAAGTPGAGAAVSQAAGQQAQEAGEEAATAPPQPKRASRWMQADAAEAAEVSAAAAAAAEAAAAAAAQQQQGGRSPGGGAAGDAASDGEHQGRAASDGEEGGLSPGSKDAGKRCVSMLEECRSVDCYEKLNRISEGTYGVVYRARDRETGEICALKKVKLEKERDGFPLTSIREINILLSLDHPHIVNVSEVVVGPSLDAVFMVMEYADHDLKMVMEERMTQPFSIAEVKTLMMQLLSGMAYLHDNWVLHRDLKTSNILYTNRGELKLCDFGLARQYGSPLAPYTAMVVTLWYRAPELLLGQRKYSTPVDVWSIGCIMAELLSKEALFQARTEIELLTTILKTIGSPTEQSWPGLTKLPNARKLNLGKYSSGTLRQRFPPASLGFDGRPSLSEAGFDLLSRLLELCPEKRISCEEALDHAWFREHPLPKDKALMPTFPSTTDQAQARQVAAQRQAAARRRAAQSASTAGK
ncbi:Cyclin-dependent kinase G-2 [Chlorella vulgaris]